MRKQVDRLVDEALRDTDFFRVDSSAKGTPRSPVITVFVDGDKGINIDDCARISRDLHDRIEESDFCPNGFELNVSSPGVERSLRLPRQYARHIGRDVRLEVSEAGSNSTIEGRLLGTAGDAVLVEGASGQMSLPLGRIRKAVVKTAW